MAYPVMPLGFLGSQGDRDSYRIERSLRFNSADTAYLSGPLGSDGNRKTWTFSAWVKRSSLGSRQFIMGNASASGTNGFSIEFDASDCINLGNYTTGYANRLTTNAVFRDVASWYHIVFAHDTTKSTSSDRFKLYVNGSLVSSFSIATYPTLDYEGYVNLAVRALTIGRAGAYNNFYFNGYLAEINFIEGQALDASSFGEADDNTGRWKARAYTGAYGTRGFCLKFADNSGITDVTLGKDSGGSGNNHTPSNFSVDNTTNNGIGNDSLVDSPTSYGYDNGAGGEVRGNYATLNPLAGNSTLVDGNLRPSTTGVGLSTVGMSSGKWYCEQTVIAVGTTSDIGIHTGTGFSTYVGSTASGYSYTNNGQKTNNAVGVAYGATYTSGDIIGCAFNADDGELSFYKNGVPQGVAFTGLTSGPYFFGIYGRSAATANNVYINFGQRPWKYAAPSGFKALCTTNLPQPTIQKPSKYMDVVTYTGNGSTQTIGGLNFNPDLVWGKSRSAVVGHAIVDRVRGNYLTLQSNTTGSEVSLNSYNLDTANSIVVNNSNETNQNGATYVAWAWDEAPIAGMDIVSYTGNGTSGRTVLHSLGVKPSMMIAKNRSSSARQWVVWHRSLSSDSHYLFLDSTAAQANTFGEFQGSSSTTFTIGNDNYINFNGDNYIAYLFAEVEGFSKFGSYTGNGSADGPFVWCGFRPRWVMVKSVGEAGGWTIMDSSRLGYNAANSTLYAQATTVEQGYLPIDILSNGFKIRIISTGTSFNTNGIGYIFAAFAEYPFKYSRSR